MKSLQCMLLVKTFTSQLWICLSGFFYKVMICSRLAFDSQVARLEDFVVSCNDRGNLSLYTIVYNVQILGQLGKEMFFFPP